jgi:lysophospholipase L1-like esterase
MTAAPQAHITLKRLWMRAGILFVMFFSVGAFMIHRAARIPQGDANYVAIGSSFAAGPGDGERAVGSYLPCFRSSANYAHLFAEQAELKLTDVTCSGATTRDVLDGGQFFQSAQLDAVRGTTKLVTITIGGNDVSYLGNLGAWACANDPADVPVSARLLGVCRSTANSEVEEAYAGLPAQLEKIVYEIHRRATAAQVVFIDYTDVLPDTGTCSELRLSPQQANAGRESAMRLATITAEVAWKTRSGLIQASQITHGHDVCSSQPWVYGFQFPKHSLSSGPVPFHPKFQAMQAIASVLAESFSGGSNNTNAEHKQSLQTTARP